MNKRVLHLTRAALIAALYATLTWLSAMLGLSGGAVQIRLGEMLTVLPAWSSAAIPGLAVGCLIANLITGCLPWDVLLGTAATLLGALGSRACRRMPIYVRVLPPILANTLIVPPVLMYVYGSSLAYPVLVCTVALGEILSAGVLGGILDRFAPRFFPPRLP